MDRKTGYWLLAALLLAVCTCGSATADFHQWAQKPPMGWNSYDCYNYAVTEQQVNENADYMAAHLSKLGWNYVVIDYLWYLPKSGIGDGPEQNSFFRPRLNMDAYGRLMPDESRFPSARGGKGFKPLADYVHSKGLKFGMHIMRGISRQAVAANMPILNSTMRAADAADRNSICGWLNHIYGTSDSAAGQAYLDSLFELYASWGVDFVKVDDISFPYQTSEVERYRKAIDRCGRPIVLSLSPGATPLENADHAAKYSNMWRLLGDLWDNWPQMKVAFVKCHEWEKSIGNGHWPDPDMLPLGRLRKYGPPYGPPDTDSLLTQDEQRTMMTLWCITRSPLMIGGNLPETNPFTLSLITNPEVLAVNQNSTGNHQLFNKDGLIAWVADVPQTQAKYLALFNTSDEAQTIKVNLADLGFSDACSIRDLWQRQNLGSSKDVFAQEFPAHGAGMYRLSPAR